MQSTPWLLAAFMLRLRFYFRTVDSDGTHLLGATSSPTRGDPKFSGLPQSFTMPVAVRIAGNSSLRGTGLPGSRRLRRKSSGTGLVPVARKREHRRCGAIDNCVIEGRCCFSCCRCCSDDDKTTSSALRPRLAANTGSSILVPLVYNMGGQRGSHLGSGGVMDPASRWT